MRVSIITLFLLSSIFCVAQISFSEKKLLLSTNNDNTSKKNYAFAKNPKNEFEFLFSNLFLFYKSFVSSQDASRCSFTPSCSEYAIIAIKNQGIIIGGINFFDRFSRCNTVSPENYDFDLENKSLIDPVRNIKFKLIHTQKSHD